MANKPKSTYNDIRSLTGLEGVRAKLSMYLGGTQAGEDGESPRALVQMLTETVSNALDEYVAGYGDEVRVIRFKDDTVGVLDHGRGVPHGKNLDDMLRAFTVPHSSGKFDDNAYASVGVAGTHGIGMKAVNAASREMLVVSKRADTGVAALRFSRGKLVESSANKAETDYTSLMTSEIDVVLKEWLKTSSTGTAVFFLPDNGRVSELIDLQLLESISLSRSDFTKQLRTAAFLHPGVKTSFEDEIDGSKLEWCYKHGLTEYMAERDDVKMDQIISIHHDGIPLSNIDSDAHRSISYDVSFYPSMNGSIECYVNGVPSRQGVHVTAARNGFTQAVKRVTGKAYGIDDVMSALAIVLHVKIPSAIAQFEGQTKDTLATGSIRKPLRDALTRSVSDRLLSDKKFIREIETCVKAQAKRRKAVERLNEQAKRVRDIAKKPAFELSSKLKNADSKDPAERELYIVEGDSAANIGRNPRTQAVFPIRGKIINAMKRDMADVLKNEEVTTLIAALGAGLLDDFDPKQLKYHKILLMQDADVDGYHISMLLVGVMFKLFPGLIESGSLYHVVAPLYKATTYVNGKPKHVMVYTDEEMQKRQSQFKAEGYTITRFKGLGEMNVEEARETLANPKTRRLERITIEDGKRAASVLDMLIGDNIEARREWVYNHLADA